MAPAKKTQEKAGQDAQDRFLVLFLSVPYDLDGEDPYRPGQKVTFHHYAQRGDVIGPLKDGDREKLLRLGAIVPADTPPERLPGYMTPVAEVTTSVSTKDAERRIVPEPTAPVVAPPLDPAKIDAWTDDQLQDWIGGQTISGVTDVVGDDANLALRVIAAETAAQGGDPRKGLIDAMRKLTTPPADPSDQE